MTENLDNSWRAYAVDGFDTSKKELLEFESKYGISSKEFYDKLNNYECCNEVFAEDVADWIFSCNCFLSCGGDLINLENTVGVERI